jgi:2',3'-cyclic-nucleotide 2'-phosphodiesterase (5'-nucleotidase family)
VGEIHLITDGKTIRDFNFSVLEVRPGKIKPSPKVAEIVEAYEAQAGKKLDEVIGELKTDWSRSGVETNLGNWLTDAMRTYTGADIGIQNNGGIRKDLPAGPIRVRDIWEISPFSNEIITFTVTGKEVQKMLDFQVKRGISLQFSGVTFVADTSKETAKKVRIHGKWVIPWKKYTVATNNYVGEQLEKYLGISDREVKNLGILDRDLFLKAVRDQKIIDSKIEGRITIR